MKSINWSFEMETDTRKSIPNDRSGLDLDVWGDEATMPVAIPKPGESCILQDEDGGCPIGCRKCVEFADQMDLNHGDDGGHGE